MTVLWGMVVGWGVKAFEELLISAHVSLQGGLGGRVTAGPSTTLLRSSGRDDNSLEGGGVFPSRSCCGHNCCDPNRIVIPTGAPQERGDLRLLEHAPR
jgi:hypothetical protein